ncbi:DNA-invertase hin [Haloferax massiliensis]|uniref:DNA-invertase hin n=2 Tax=Haloferax massiliensis TaxID=1476858 RepID=A0A0D6JN36_9EURY|nr:DNA-invertase hin [Haloferax massiliensis]
MGWETAYLFKDEAESGKDTDRPMFQQMMRAAKNKCFDVVVFWKLDRFSRSLLHAVELEAELREHDVALHSVTEQIDTTTSAGRFNFRNIASAAEFERDMISERTQMGLKALALEKRWPNDRPPVGYRKNAEGRLDIDSKEAELVKEIFSRYLHLKSMPQLAHELNDDGRTTEVIREWTPRAVRDVLTNELYTGLYSVADVIEFVPEYRIISKEQFEQVTKVRHRFKSTSDSRRNPMPQSRKARLVESVINEYRSYLEEESSE